MFGFSSNGLKSYKNKQTTAFPGETEDYQHIIKITEMTER